MAKTERKKGRAVDVIGEKGVGVVKLLEEHFSKAFMDRQDRDRLK